MHIFEETLKDSGQVVPAAFYEPIEQGAVLISKDQIKEPSQMWMGYLRTESVTCPPIIGP